MKFVARDRGRGRQMQFGVGAGGRSLLQRLLEGELKPVCIHPPLALHWPSSRRAGLTVRRRPPWTSSFERSGLAPSQHNLTRAT